MLGTILWNLLLKIVNNSRVIDLRGIQYRRVWWKNSRENMQSNNLFRITMLLKVNRINKANYI